MPDSKRPAPMANTLGRRTFSTARRGYDQDEVKAYLEALSYEFRDLRDRITELEEELDAERARPAPEAPKLDFATLTSALGEETARVLRTAQEAAEDMRTRAEEGAARTLKEAHDDADRIRSAAESILSERTAEADQEAARIRREAEEETATLRRDATAEAEATIAKAVEQGRDMLSQAQAARERVLSDLARRRKVALTQIDQLRAGRERLHAKLHGARIELERMMDDLARSDEEARLAEESVGHVAVKSPEPPEEEAEEAEVETPTAETADAEPEPVEESEGAADAGAAAPGTDNHTGTAAAVGTQAHAEGDAAGADAGAKESRSPTPRPPYRHDPVPAGLLPDAAVGAPTTGESKGRVDELFARIRADRAEKVEAARAVLADNEPEQPAPEPAVEATEGAPEGPAPALEAPRSDEDESLLQRRDSALEKPTATTVRAVRRGLGDDQNTALERLRTARAAHVDVDALLGGETEQLARAAAWATPGLAASSKAGTRLAGGTDAALAADVIAPIATRLAEGIIGPLRQRMEELLVGAGGDRGPDTVDRINSIYREVRGRIDLLVGDAVTEVVSAALAAHLGDGSPVRWVVEDVDGPCPDCDDNALAGLTPLGQAFPTGQTAPPAHPGCRCVLAPAPA